MKKKLLLLSTIMIMGVLTACGASGKADNKDVGKYVKLGEYKGVEVEVTKTSVQQAEVDAVAREFYWDAVTAENGGIVDRPVQVDDTVNINYVGKKDGVAFQGGTADDYFLTIGSNTFINGFEDGLIGVTPGETVDLDLTFPEGYHSEELSGQDVVFTVTVNYILPTEMEDSVVAGFKSENYSNVEELNEYATEYVTSRNEAQYQERVENAVFSAVMNNAVFEEIPEEYMEKYEQIAASEVAMYASYYGMDTATYASYLYGMEYEELIAQMSEVFAKQELVFRAIANAEGLNISDEELDEKLAAAVEEAGVGSEEEYLAGADKEEYRINLMMENVYNFIQENAVVKSE